ncbi:LETM1 [Cervus elaphus hippelaphus]|uniref:LETM1 n=1 Tax=Cervus elaphus hippelaphus TaxID=46360 RepID=A0A212D5V1_CEREH|nr:LETM1 [Cervus elaphus hippelaphus]
MAGGTAGTCTRPAGRPWDRYPYGVPHGRRAGLLSGESRGTGCQGREGAGQGALGAVAAGLVVARLWGGFCLGDKVDGSTSAGVRSWELELEKVLEVYQNPKNVLCAHQHGISKKRFTLGFGFPGPVGNLACLSGASAVGLMSYVLGLLTLTYVVGHPCPPALVPGVDTHDPSCVTVSSPL